MARTRPGECRFPAGYEGEADITAVLTKIRSNALDVHVSRGTERTLIGAIGDERNLDPETQRALIDSYIAQVGSN